MNRHLNAGLSTGAFKDQIKPFLLAKLRKGGCDLLFRLLESLFSGLRSLSDWEAMDILGKPAGFREVQPSLIDVDCHNFRGTSGFGEGACQEANGTNAENQDCLSPL